LIVILGLTRNPATLALLKCFNVTGYRLSPVCRYQYLASFDGNWNRIGLLI
jgi:hypothetical protein